jgi:hypothetical protein
MFLATLAAYKSTLTNYTLRPFHYVRRQKEGTTENIIITYSYTRTNFVYIKELIAFEILRFKEF